MKMLSRLALSTLILAASFTAQAETRAVIEIDMDNIDLSLDETKAPRTVTNFISYARKDFYDNTVFRRVIDDFVIQGSGFTPDMVQKVIDKVIGNKAGNGLKNTIGTIAMARTDNPNSTTSQFLINTVDDELPNFKSKTTQSYSYTVSGRATSSMEVVERIVKVQTIDHGYHQNVPVKPVIIRRVTIGQ